MNEIDTVALYCALFGLFVILSGSLIVLMTLFEMSLNRAVKRCKTFNKKGEQRDELKIRYYS
jgi:hypothetical protein